MVEFAPSTGGLALWAHHEDLPAGRGETAHIATDGAVLYYHTGFEQLPIAQQVGLVAHEVLHIALRHPQRLHELRQLLGDVDVELFNICADAIVNSTLSHLSWLQLPASAVFLDRLLQRALGIDQAVESSLLQWDVEQLYRAIDDRRRASRQGRRTGQRSEQGGTQANAATHGHGRSQREIRADGPREDGPRAARVRQMGAGGARDLLPGSGAQLAPEVQAEQAREWSERILRAHAGDGAHSMLRTLIADLPRTRTPWEQVLRTQLARSLAPRSALSWSRPSRSYLANQGRIGPHRRMPWEPGYTQSKSVPRLIVIVDVSGSIDQDLMQRFAREIEGITRRLEAGLVLIIGDDRVQRVERFEPGHADLSELEFRGGGGTDFTPLLAAADTYHPDIVVVLTDLDGPAHFRPRWPVIWAVPESHRHAVQPFGRKLALR
jgi:predicted metal-dependent peptidase